LRGSGESGVLNVSSLHSPLLVTVTAVAAVVLGGVPQSSADTYVVVFRARETSELLSNVSYPSPPPTTTIKHLVTGLSQGRYSVTCDDPDVVCSTPPFYCYNPDNVEPDGPPPNSLEFTSSCDDDENCDDRSRFEIIRIGDLPPAPAPPVIVLPVNSDSDYPHYVLEESEESVVLVAGTCEADIEFLTIKVNGEVPSPPGVAGPDGDLCDLYDLPDDPGSSCWSYTCTLTESERYNRISVTATRYGRASNEAFIIVIDDNVPPLPTTFDGKGFFRIDGENFFTNNRWINRLGGECDPMTTAITVAIDSTESSEDHAAGDPRWSYSVAAAEADLSESEAFAIQNEGTTNLEVFDGVEKLDSLWSPADIIPDGTVIHDRYACDLWPNALDALSLVFEPGEMDLSNLALLAYLQKASSRFTHWEHYELLAGTNNPQDEDLLVEANDGRDHFPGGQLDNNEIVGWVELPFDATSDPRFDVGDDRIGVTLRLWNWRVNAVKLVERTGFLSVGINDFTVTASGEGFDSSVDIAIILDVEAPEVEITSDGGNGPGNDFTTTGQIVTIGGTCQDDWVVAAVEVNGSTSGVSLSTESGAWSYYAVLTLGSNTFVVTARDAAGNVSPEDSVTIVYELPPPRLHGTPATSWLGSLVLCAAVIVLATIGQMGRKVRSAR